MNDIKSLFIALLLLVSSCASQKNGGEFRKEAVSFKFPSGWSITEQDDLDGAGYYLSVENTGFDASGLLTITWVNGVLEDREYLEIIQRGYLDQKLFNELKFGLVNEGYFNKIPSISSDFNYSTLGVKHNGVMYVFVKDDKTYSIIKQQAVEDAPKQKQDFDSIVASFNVE